MKDFSRQLIERKRNGEGTLGLALGNNTNSLNTSRSGIMGSGGPSGSLLINGENKEGELKLEDLQAALGEEHHNPRILSNKKNNVNNQGTLDRSHNHDLDSTNRDEL